MRVTSHCSTHPSREASVRCRQCRRWLCERCVQRSGHRIYCSLKCRFLDLFRSSREWVADGSHRALHPLRVALGILAGFTLLVLPTAWLLSSLGPAPSAPLATAELHLERVADPARPRIRIEGPPGASVLLVSGGRPLAVHHLGDSGRLEVEVPSSAWTAHLGAYVLPGPAAELAPPPPVATPAQTPEPAPPAPDATTPPDPIHSPPAPGVTPSVSPDSPSPTPDDQIRVLPLPVPERQWRFPWTPTPRLEPDVPASATPAPTSRPERPVTRRRDGRTPPVLHLLPDAGPRLALTFDGNSLSTGTAELLDLLETLELEVTLFVTGEFIERDPALVRRALLAGHEVGNHLATHPRLTSYARNQRHDLLPGVDRDFLAGQLERTAAAFRQATGREMVRLWRAPYGEENGALRRWALEEGWLHVRWSSLAGASLDSLDWVDDEHSPLYRDADRMVRRLLQFPRLEGGIVLMHLASERPTPPWSRLPELVTELRSRGIELVKTVDLIEASPTWRPWLERARRNAQERSASSGSAPRR